MLRISRIVLPLLVCLSLSIVAYAGEQFSPHAAFLAQHRDVAPNFATYAPTVPLQETKGVYPYEVMGFYPYWVTVAPDELPLSKLKTIAFFSLEINQYGNLTNLHGWPDGELVDVAHDHGVRVVVTVTNFSASQQSTLLASATNRANAIDKIIEQVEEGDADGVNLDFEGLPASAKANYVTFVTELRAALEEILPDPHFTVCTPAIDWSGAYDFDKLAAQTDYLFVMAYDYHYSGGDPGPVAPLYAGGIWPYWAGIDYTLDDYETYISPYTLSKTILGLPLYGYDWPTASAEVPGQSLGSADAVILDDALDMANGGAYGAKHWDDYSKTDYLTYYDDTWRQLWWGGYKFYRMRFGYGLQRDCGGVGFWALGYTKNTMVWDALEDAMEDTDDDDDDDDDNDSGCGGW